MVRVGLTRWLVTARRVNIGHGEVRLEAELASQARSYLVPLVIWKGINREVKDTIVQAPSYLMQNTFLQYGLKANAEMMAWRQMAEEIAGRAVRDCTAKGIAELNDDELAQTRYIVTVAVMKAVETGKSDDPEFVEVMDIRNDMLAIRNEKARQAAEAERIEMEALAAHIVEAEWHGNFFIEGRSETYNAALGLLERYLNESEKREARERGCITVHSLAGDFVVPIRTHGLVEQYVNKKYVSSYCIVFSDYSIPCGDEALMKIVLLKADMPRFMRIAHKINYPARGRRR
jgi:hypothetical protein